MTNREIAMKIYYTLMLNFSPYGEGKIDLIESVLNDAEWGKDLPLKREENPQGKDLEQLIKVTQQNQVKGGGRDAG